MDSNQNQDKPSVQLNGFAPASGSGAASLSTMPGPAAAPASAAVTASASAESSSAAAGAGGGAGGDSPEKKSAATSSKAKRTHAKKKQRGGGASSSSAAAPRGSDSNDNDAEETVLRPLSDVGPDFAPLSLPQIRLRIKSLLGKLPGEVPAVPPAYDADDAGQIPRHAPIKAFASTLQVVIEEYNLLLSLVSAATYKWGVDRSGASQQNLSVMSAELQQCQDVITNVVSARLSNVLCPAVDVVVGEVEVVRGGGEGGTKGGDNGETNGDSASSSAPSKKRKLLNGDNLNSGGHADNERRVNHFARPVVDPSYVHLCHCILARNAPLIRHTVATSIHAAQKVIGDYLKAMKKDASHDSGKGGYY